MSSSIASAVPRRRTTLRGEVVSVVGVSAPWARTDVVLGDGSGTLTLRFVGRLSVPGIETGRRLVVEGTPSLVGGDLVMLNPVYSFEEAG